MLFANKTTGILLMAVAFGVVVSDLVTGQELPKFRIVFEKLKCLNADEDDSSDITDITNYNPDKGKTDGDEPYLLITAVAPSGDISFPQTSLPGKVTEGQTLPLNLTVVGRQGGVQVGPGEAMAFNVTLMERDGSDAQLPQRWREEIKRRFEEEGGKQGMKAGMTVCAKAGPLGSLACGIAGEKLGEVVGKKLGEWGGELANELFQEIAEEVDPDDKIGVFETSFDYQSLMILFDDDATRVQRERYFEKKGVRYRLDYFVEKVSGDFKNTIHRIEFERTNQNEGKLYVEYSLVHGGVKYLVPWPLNGSEGFVGTRSTAFAKSFGTVTSGYGIEEIPIKYVGEPPERDAKVFHETNAFYVAFHNASDFIRNQSQPENGKLLAQPETWGDAVNRIRGLTAGQRRLYISHLPLTISSQYIGNAGDVAFVTAQAWSLGHGFDDAKTNWVRNLNRLPGLPKGVSNMPLTLSLVQPLARGDNWMTDRIRVTMYSASYQVLDKKDFQVKVTWGTRPDNWGQQIMPDRPGGYPPTIGRQPPITWQPGPVYPGNVTRPERIPGSPLNPDTIVVPSRPINPYPGVRPFVNPGMTQAQPQPQGNGPIMMLPKKPSTQQGTVNGQPQRLLVNPGKMIYVPPKQPAKK